MEEDEIFVGGIRAVVPKPAVRLGALRQQAVLFLLWYNPHFVSPWSEGTEPPSRTSFLRCRRQAFVLMVSEVLVQHS